jgi:hypothetical protein
MPLLFPKEVTNMRLAIAYTLSLLAIVPFAHADTLAPSHGEYYYSILGNPTDYQSVLSPTRASDAYHSNSPVGSVGAFFNGGVDPAVGSFVGSSGAANTYDETAFSYAYYEFEVVGPAGQTASVNIAGSLSAAVSNLTANSGSNASLGVVLPSDPASPDDGAALQVLFSDRICAGTTFCRRSGSPSLSASSDVNQFLSVITNTAYVVQLYSETDITSGPNGGAISSVDPTITLATTDPAYSLEFSPGVGPSPAPEPSGLFLLGTGIFSVVCIKRRRLGAF